MLVADQLRNLSVVVNREGLAPVPLAAENRIAQPVVDLPGANAFIFQVGNGQRDGFHRGLTVEFSRIAQGDVFLGVDRFIRIDAIENGGNGQVVRFGKFPIALIARRYGHDGAGAVSSQDVVGNPHRDFLSGERMHGVTAGKAPADFVVACALAFALRFLGGGGLVGSDGFLLLRRGEHLHQFMFRRQDHEAHSVDGVRSGREHLDGVLGQAFGAKVHRRAFAAADPIALGFFDAVGPIESVQVVDEALGKGRSAHDPLAHPLADHGVTAALA